MDTLRLILLIIGGTGLLTGGLLLTWHTRLPRERLYQGRVSRIVQCSPVYLEVEWTEPTSSGDILCCAHSGMVDLPDRDQWRLLVHDARSVVQERFEPGAPVTLIMPHHWRPGWNVEVLGAGTLSDLTRQQCWRGAWVILMSLPPLIIVALLN